MLLIYLLLINVIALCLYGYDKYCAMTHQWRVPEKALLTSAIIGGAIGAYIGMLTFRHKTNHKKFQISIPIICIVQAIIFLIIY